MNSETVLKKLGETIDSWNISRDWMKSFTIMDSNRIHVILSKPTPEEPIPKGIVNIYVSVSDLDSNIKYKLENEIYERDFAREGLNENLLNNLIDSKLNLNKILIESIKNMQ